MFHYIAGASGGLWITLCGQKTAEVGQQGAECQDCVLVLELDQQMNAESPLWAMPSSLL